MTKETFSYEKILDNDLCSIFPPIKELGLFVIP